MEFLIGLAILAAVGIVIVWLRSRPSSDLTKSVESFQRARRALDPEKERDPGRSRSRNVGRKAAARSKGRKAS